MKISRLALLLCALVAIGLAGCGGGDDEVPADAVAVVDGEEFARQDYDAVISQAKTSYKNQKREFPAAGSQEFQTLRNQVVQFLVQREQFEQEAADLGVEVTDKQVDAQIEEYYAKNKAQYSQPESREVRHILVKTKAKADDLYDQLKNGADFAALAKKHSEDTGSKANGGKLTISKGQTVAPFDQTAFLLKKNDISRPVKTEFGFHIIQPIGDVKEAKVTPLKDVKDSIRQQLTQTKKNETMTKWVEDLKKDYEDKVSYAVGFNPPP